MIDVVIPTTIDLVIPTIDANALVSMRWRGFCVAAKDGKGRQADVLLRFESAAGALASGALSFSETWKNAESNDTVCSCTNIVRNAFTRAIPDRMPALIERADLAVG